MITSASTIIILVIVCIFMNIFLLYLFKKRNSTQTHRIFIIMCILMLFWLIELILQATFSKTLNINPIYFDYFVYINICFIPVCFLALSMCFTNTTFKFNKKFALLTIIPILSLLVLWTNDFHHLFYINYSINLSDTVYGSYFYVYTIYSYLLLAISIVKLVKYSIKNAGFFSKQSILLILGALAPIGINVLGAIGLINISIYITPISFAIAIFFFALAILKFDFLKFAPIALQRIVDRISDSYIVVNENNIVTDFNETFLELFKVKSQDIRNRRLEDLFKKFNKKYGIKEDLILRFCRKSKKE